MPLKGQLSAPMLLEMQYPEDQLHTISHEIFSLPAMQHLVSELWNDAKQPQQDQWEMVKTLFFLLLWLP